MAPDPTKLEQRLAEALEELVLLKSGKPYHFHVDPLSLESKRCSSPYCVDLTPDGFRGGPGA